MHVRKNDVIQIIAGDDLGKTGKVLQVMTAKQQVLVEGINFVFRHSPKTQENPQGGRVQKEAPISVSNVLLYCSKCERGVRVGRKSRDDGAKIRFCKHCDQTVGFEQ